MAIHPILSSLSLREDDVFTAITTGYEAITALDADQISPQQMLRRELMMTFVDLADVCYDDYLSKRSHIRITEQDVWIPCTRDMFDLIEQFGDRDALKSVFENWLRNYNLYRRWLSSCRLSRSKLAELWSILEDSNVDSDSDSDDDTDYQP